MPNNKVFQASVADLKVHARNAVQLGKQSSVRIWLEKGESLMALERYPEALKAFDKALEIDPSCAEAYCKRGLIWMRRIVFESDKALADFNKALEINPELALAYWGRGNAYNKKHQYDRAIADFNKALEINPGFVSAYICRAASWNGKGDYDQAIADCNKALEIDPNSWWAYSSRGQTWLRKGDIQAAVDDTKKASELATDPIMRKAAKNFAEFLEKSMRRKK
jgi:tetratricopeptide (TPR) repeat protein